MSENQFGFILGRSTTKAVHLIRRPIELYRNRKKNLHMVFIDLEKAYDKVSREILGDCLEKKEVLVVYIQPIKDMYDGVKTNVSISTGDTKYFHIDIGLHQGLGLSAFLFTIVMDDITLISVFYGRFTFVSGNKYLIEPRLGILVYVIC